jgi:Spy/CpxP family protein refolding chaperone
MASAMPDAAAQGRAYFRQHSFDFATVFRAQHPGPDWILQHASDFNLTPAQTTKLEHLRDGMRGAVAQDSAKLKQAYTQYAADARTTAPQQRTMLNDVQAVGRAQTQLAGAMIPYHLQSYAVLDAAQKKTYERLVAAAGS